MATRGPIGASAIVLTLLAACTSPAPSPAASSRPEPPPTRTAEATPAPEPVVVCSESGWTPEPELTCEAAVEAALAGLPEDHPPIASIEFGWGNYCPPGRFCAAAIPGFGFVVLTMQGASPDKWVRVVADGGGTVLLASEYEPFPPLEGRPADPGDRAYALTCQSVTREECETLVR